MTYEMFKEEIRANIQKQLGPQAVVNLHSILKNNNVHLDALTIQEDSINISPTIYLNYYYEEYENGSSLLEVTQEILALYRKNKTQQNMDLTFFTNYENVKSILVFKLINYKRNFDLLKDVPHFKILDLAIVFECVLSKNEEVGNATILIHNHHLKYWNVNREDLYRAALKNTPDLLPGQIENMQSVIQRLMYEEQSFDFAPEEEAFPMYVLTNSMKLHGASCILYENMLSEFADQLKSDLYILPSSIHEVLLIPVDAAPEEKELSDMVKEVNATQVLDEEILSDHVYFFSREKSALLM